MPARCPKGHVSTDPDYCSECGAKMPAAPSGIDAASISPSSSRASASSVLAAAQSGSSQICPDCSTPRATPTATFCEVCRYNYVTQTSWATPKVPGQPAAFSAPVSANVISNIVSPFIASPIVTPDMSLPPSSVTPATSSSADVSAPAVSSAVTGDYADPSGLNSNISSNVNAMSTADASSRSFAPVQDTLTSSPPTAVDSPQSNISSPDGLTQAAIARWEARLTVDPSLNVDPDPALPCPVGEPERVFPLDFPDNLIGRRSEKRGIFPEINVNDPCSSHRHAKIQRQADGSFALLDVGSTNGTQLNGKEVQPNVLTPLQDGDQITLGCWTRIIIRGLRS